MIRPLLFIFLMLGWCASAQDDGLIRPAETPRGQAPEAAQARASIDQYRIISIERDTVYADTSLTIAAEYRHNYLRRDIFGLLPFANEGQPYTVLDFGIREFDAYPQFGYRAKHFNYLGVDDIRYFSVATPFTDLYFKSVMEQGQNVDALVTVNTSEQLNFSVAYKGLRSLGKYINQLTSAGNFRFTTSYHTKNRRYMARFHYAGQDLRNGENGGIASTDDFESDNVDFRNRARLEVYFKDAQSFLIGKRLFLDHEFKITKPDAGNAISVFHRINYEYKKFEWTQPTVASTITNADGTTTVFSRFGPSYVNAGIHDQARYNRLFNRAGVSYSNALLGDFRFFLENFSCNYFFDRVLILDSGTIPALLSEEINAAGAEYRYRRGKWNGVLHYSNSISEQPMSTIDAKVHFDFNERNRIMFRYGNINKVPDLLFRLHQSSFVAYNWNRGFKNEKINFIEAVADTRWLTASAEFRTLNDYLYFGNDAVNPVQLVSPKQYDGTINYLSVKLSREFKFRKFGFDTTVLYQQVEQEEPIVNVPEIVTRNTLYYNNYFFKRALFLQTGFTLNYFTKYYADDYNPHIAEFFVQREREIGGFPMVDFFVNARVRQTRLFLKAEHVNALLRENNYYTAPNYPYRDFLVRFGIEWNFFQ